MDSMKILKNYSIICIVILASLLYFNYSSAEDTIQNKINGKWNCLQKASVDFDINNNKVIMSNIYGETHEYILKINKIDNNNINANFGDREYNITLNGNELTLLQVGKAPFPLTCKK